MDIFTIGSLTAYTKNIRLQTQWDLKKSTGNVTAHSKSLSDMLQKTQEAATYQEQIDRDQDSDSDKLQKIMDKISAGKKLTADEKEYLRAKDPVLYAQIQAADQERQSYERELKRCKTKDEVHRVQNAHLNASLTRLKSVENNPHIPDGEKYKSYAVEKYFTERVHAATRAFVKRGTYAKLPTDAEKHQAEREEREIRNAEQHPTREQNRIDEKSTRMNADPRADDQPRMNANPRTDDESRMNDAARTDDKPRTGHTDADRIPEHPDAKTVRNHASVKPDKSAVPMESDTLRKVRRAKVRAAYAANASAFDSDSDSDLSSIDTRA